MLTLATRQADQDPPADDRTHGVGSRHPCQRRVLRITVEPHQAEACLRIRDDLRRRGKRIDTVEATDFIDPALAEMAEAISQHVHSVAGFFVLRGLPFDGWTDEEASMLYWGLGTYLGRPLQQNRDGDRVYLVQDTGATLMEARGSKTNLGDDLPHRLGGRLRRQPSRHLGSDVSAQGSFRW